MSNPCPETSCPHIVKITEMKADSESIKSLLQDLKSDVKDMKKTLELIASLEQKQQSHKEALDRAFIKLKEIESRVDEHESLYQQFKGMKWVIVTLVGCSGTGLGLLLSKFLGG